MAGYVYNPAESIRQDFQQTGSAVGNIFAQVIQQQQRDYTLAENAFSNIEALKKDLNIYGQKSITSKANTLLGHASSAILQNGKLDYSKMGEIRQAVSDIKDLKAGYELGAKEYERMLQMGIANKDNLTSFESFYKDLSAKMSDENLIKNPRDLQNALLDTYTNNLNSQKMFDKFYLGMRPYEKGEFTYTDEKGNQVKVAGEAPTGWRRDAKGNVLPPEPITKTLPDGTVATVDYADEILSTIPTDLLAVMKKQAGPAAANMPDKELVKYFASRIPMTKSAIQVKSAAAIKGEESQANILGFKEKHLQEEFDQEMRTKKLANQLTQAQINKLNAEAAAEEVSKTSNGEVFRVNFPAAKKGDKMVGNVAAKGTDLGGLVTMIVPTTTGNKNLNVKQVFYDSKGNARISYIEEIPAAKGGVSGYPNLTLPGIGVANTSDKASKSEQLKYATIPKNKVNSFLSGLKSNIRAKYKDDKDYGKVWGNVKETFTVDNQQESGVYSSGDIVGNTIYLSRSYQKDEAQILKQSGAKKVIYID